MKFLARWNVSLTANHLTLVLIQISMWIHHLRSFKYTQIFINTLVPWQLQFNLPNNGHTDDYKEK